MSIEDAQIDRSPLTARRTREAEPRKSGGDCGANGRIEPQLAPAGLSRVPDSDDLLRIGNRLALGLGALRFLRGSGGGSLPFLFSAVWTHGCILPTQILIVNPKSITMGTARSPPRTEVMPVETFTYAALGQRLNCSPEAARALAKRLRLPRQKANDGRALVTVDLAEIEHKPLPARSPPGHPSVAETMQTRIEALETELAKVEAAAAGHRADFERERDRSDKLLSEVLRATVDLMSAKDAAARAEGELVVVRVQAQGEREAAMRAQAELEKIRARRWWRRLTA